MKITASELRERIRVALTENKQYMQAFIEKNAVPHPEEMAELLARQLLRAETPVRRETESS